MVTLADEFFDGFLDDYFAECAEHLTAARSALLALETSADSPRPSGESSTIYSGFHSLKGISAMVELQPAERRPRAENYLRRRAR